MQTKLQIKFITSLQHKKFRDKYRKFICEGDKMIQELLENQPNSAEEILATSQWVEKNQFSHPNLSIVSTKDIEKISSQKTSSQVLAVCDMTKLIYKNQEEPVSLYADRISDPGNLGTIIRTCDWFGVHQVYLSPNSVEVFNPKVVQSTMGAIFRVQTHVEDLNELISKKNFKDVLSTDMHGVALEKVKVQRPTLLIMGSESHGISKEFKEKSTQIVSIPGVGSSESLNVAVATGIFLNYLTK